LHVLCCALLGYHAMMMMMMSCHMIRCIDDKIAENLWGGGGMGVNATGQMFASLGGFGLQLATWPDRDPQKGLYSPPHSICAIWAAGDFVLLELKVFRECAQNSSTIHTCASVHASHPKCGGSSVDHHIRTHAPSCNPLRFSTL